MPEPSASAPVSEVPDSPQLLKDKTIGQVLSALDADFPGISASKIRFLEDKGLVHPQRTNTGYRKYSAQDVQQLRYILTLQRDYYLPLKVIKERIESGEFLRQSNNDEPTDVSASTVTTTAAGATTSGDGNSPLHAVGLSRTAIDSGRSYTLRELSERARADMPLLRELINFGLIREVEGLYDDYDVAITKVCAELTAHGIQPRHLRQFRAAAEREVGLVESAVAPLASRKDDESQAKAALRAQEIANLCMRLHMALVASSMPSYER